MGYDAALSESVALPCICPMMLFLCVLEDLSSVLLFRAMSGSTNIESIFEISKRWLFEQDGGVFTRIIEHAQYAQR